MFRINYKNGQNKTFSFNNFKGNKSMTVWTEGSKRPFSFPLGNPTAYARVKAMFKKVLASDGQACRTALTIKKWDTGAKQLKPYAIFAMGVNDQGIYFFELYNIDEPPAVFEVKGNSSYEGPDGQFSATEKSKVEFTEVAEQFHKGTIWDIPESYKPDNNNSNSSSNQSSNSSPSEDF